MRAHRLRPRTALVLAALTCTVALSACSAEADDAAYPDRGALTEVALEIVGGAEAVTVVTGDTDGALFSADGSSLQPTTTETGPGRYALDFSFPEGSRSAATVRLDPEIVWHLTFTGGAQTLTVDLSEAAVSGLDFTSGAQTFDLTLPEPTGVVPINQSGGAATFAVHLPADAAATVSLQGFGSATVDSTALDAADSTTAVGDTAATDRFVITNSAGLGSFTLDRS